MAATQRSSRVGEALARTDAALTSSCPQLHDFEKASRRSPARARRLAAAGSSRQPAAQRSGVPKLLLAALVVSVLVVSVYANVAAELTCNLVGFLYPAVATLRTGGAQWTGYWVRGGGVAPRWRSAPSPPSMDCARTRADRLWLLRRHRVL